MDFLVTFLIAQLCDIVIDTEKVKPHFLGCITAMSFRGNFALFFFPHYV